MSKSRKEIAATEQFKFKVETKNTDNIKTVELSLDGTCSLIPSYKEVKTLTLARKTYFSPFIDALKAEITGKNITHLTLNLSQIKFDIDTIKSSKGPWEITFQNELNTLLIDLLQTGTCPIVALEIKGLKITDQSILEPKAKAHIENLLRVLATALRNNVNNIETLAFPDLVEGSHALATALAPSSSAGKRNINLKLTEVIVGQAVVLKKDNSSSQPAKETIEIVGYKAKPKNPAIDDTDIPIEDELDNDDKSSSTLAKQSVRSNDDKALLKGIGVTLKVVDVFITPPKDSSNLGKTPTNSKNAPPLSKTLNSHRQENKPSAVVDPMPKRSVGKYLTSIVSNSVPGTFIGGGMGLLPAITAFAAPAASFAFLGLTTFGAALVIFGVIAAVGLLVGIGMGIYRANQAYQQEVAAYEAGKASVITQPAEMLKGLGGTTEPKQVSVTTPKPEVSATAQEPEAIINMDAPQPGSTPTLGGRKD